MAVYTKNELKEFARAYRTLNVESSASAAQIKKSYFALTRKWHPDNYAECDVKEEQATRMMQNINSAYDLIEKAPLRFHVKQQKEYLKQTNKKGFSYPGSRGTFYDRPGRTYRPKRNGLFSERHKTVKDAAEFRRRSAGTFRFFVGVIGSAFPLTAMRFFGVSGLPFFMSCLLMPLICGIYYYYKGGVEDDGNIF